MERELRVFLDLDGAARVVGRLWARDRGTATFEYDLSWTRRQGAFALAPALPLGGGKFYSGETDLFNAFKDPAPDRWGQKLMRHYERRRAESAGSQPRTLKGIDFLAGVDDQTRMGALRFKEAAGGDFIAASNTPVPPLVDLSKLLSAADRIEKGKERKSDLVVLLAPGGSLGGARPKATIRDRDGTLRLAKFPWHEDEWPVILWEAAVLELARQAEVDVSEFRLEMVGTKKVLLANRFDRNGATVRVPYISACTALDAKDHDETRSYLELVDFLRQEGAAPEDDCRQLWRRMVFNVLVSNTDDHVRNHGFLRSARGWRLSPAFDLNPRPTDRYERIHQMALNELDATSSIELAMSVANYFGLKAAEAKSIAAGVAAAVSRWKVVAGQVGLTKAEIGRMASAFEHDDLAKAIKFSNAAASPAEAPAKGSSKKAAKTVRNATVAKSPRRRR